MSLENDRRPIVIISACMRRDGRPALMRTEVAVTHVEAENGIHYYLAEAQLLERGFEEPMVHFADGEAPEFLLAAVPECLDHEPEPDLILRAHLETAKWLV